MKMIEKINNIRNIIISGNASIKSFKDIKKGDIVVVYHNGELIAREIMNSNKSYCHYCFDTNDFTIVSYGNEFLIVDKNDKKKLEMIFKYNLKDYIRFEPFSLRK